MITIHLTTREGQKLSIEGDASSSFMEAIRGNGVDELQGLCGGQISCATCHIYIDPAFAAHLPPMSDHEDDLLDSSDYRTPMSRLSCEIPCIPELDGVAVQIAPEN
jgi:2Fe-2S ferredoxin